jgi:hypothetical protein
MDKQETEARMREKALARWEGEGGALFPEPQRDTIDHTTLRLLARLGAALLDSWDDVPGSLQRRVAVRARSIGASKDHSVVRENLGRFLDQFRDEC